MIVLYVLSVVLCGFVEKKRDEGLREPAAAAKDESQDHNGDPTTAHTRQAERPRE